MTLRARLLSHVAMFALVLTAVLSTAVTSRVAASAGYHFGGNDLHDGKMFYDYGNGNQEYVGTHYNTAFPTYPYSPCQFTWLAAHNADGTNSKFCGFGVWTYQSGWNYLGDLFDPNQWNTYDNESWQATCGSNNGGYATYGCFNARMVQRSSDGQWMLWFNAPRDYAAHQYNAYYVMTCAGPRGPCGPYPNYPGGQLYKPAMSICYDNGDFDISSDGSGTAYIVCTMHDQTLRIEKLDSPWRNGTGVGNSNLGGKTSVESPSIFSWTVGFVTYYYLTYSVPNCGYADPPCQNGTGTGYMRSTGFLNTWTVASPERISDLSCSGQPRTIGYDQNGTPYEWIDQWIPNTHSQGGANVFLEPVSVNTGTGWLNHMADC